MVVSESAVRHRAKAAVCLICHGEIAVNDYHLHELSGDDFENVVIQLCRIVLGTGIVNFSEGPDGGRDGRFHGTANRFPSERKPWAGKFIVQAKRTASPIAKCADAEFNGVLKKEYPRIKALQTDGEIDVYLLFTNRRLSGRTAPKLKKDIETNTGVKKNEVLGLETITSYLDASPEVLKTCGLFDRFRGPLIINPQELAEVIEAFRQNVGVVTAAPESKYSFEYTEIESTKNIINGLSAEYFDVIKSNSDPYFFEIGEFLRNPINDNLAEDYYTVADELKSKIAAHRKDFDAFDNVLTYLYDEIIRVVPSLNRRRRLVNVFLHYMYCNCDIGRKK